MDSDIIAKIESNEDFKILIDEVIEKTKGDIRKNIFDASVLNNDRKQMISYYEKERQKLLKKFKKDSYSFRVEFDKDNLKINKEDYEQLFNYQTYIYDYLEQIKWDKEYHLEQTVKKKKDLFKFHKKRLKDIENNIWLSYFNLKIKDYYNASTEIENNDFGVFKDKESKQFFEYLIMEWFNKLPTPKSAISFVFYSMWTNSPMPIEYRDFKFKIDVIRIIEFAEYWNDNYSDSHKHNYKIQINQKSVRIKSISEITNQSYWSKLDSCIESFEKLK
jgi:hypothetical protein